MLGGELGEINKLSLTAAGATYRRKGRGEGEESSLNSPAWKSCELPAAGGRVQSSWQKAEKWDGRKIS